MFPLSNDFILQARKSGKETRDEPLLGKPETRSSTAYEMPETKPNRMSPKPKEHKAQDTSSSRVRRVADQYAALPWGSNPSVSTSPLYCYYRFGNFTNSGRIPCTILQNSAATIIPNISLRFQALQRAFRQLTGYAAGSGRCSGTDNWLKRLTKKKPPEGCFNLNLERNEDSNSRATRPARPRKVMLYPQNEKTTDA